MQQTSRSHLSRLAHAFEAGFDVFRPAQTPQTWELAALFALMVVGAILRFWGLGSWGLGGDEKTMALPVMHLVQSGTPLMPSGMFYGRAIGQLYLMAASVHVFGSSEWALRFPSVICGILVIPLAYLLGRRFLTPVWNVAFVAAVTFLPAQIGDSQEARMYIFLVACLAAYLALLFKWERSGSIAYLIAAIATMIVGIQFHTLAVFGAFLALYPGLLHGDLRKLAQGTVAFVVMACGFAVINAWVSSLYPPRVDFYGLQAVADSRLGTLLHAQLRPVQFVLGALGAAVLAWLVARRICSRIAAAIVAALLFLGMLCELALFYHVGVLLIVAGFIVARRHAGRLGSTIVLVAAASVALAVVQFTALHASGFGSARKVVGIMAGLPSVWTYLRAISYSPVAWLVVCIGFLRALWLVARRKTISDYWLLFALGVWLPLFALGVFGWNVEVRYTEFALLPVLLCAFATCQQWMSAAESALRSRRMGVLGILAAVVATLVVVNPIAVARAVNSGYAVHPDHKGAAEYIKSLQLKPKDLIVAEDSLEQVYYLGHIDYWLVGIDTAQQFVERKHGVLFDIYTGAPLIGTAAELEALLRRPGRGDIYVIGSGEEQEDGRRFVRGPGIDDALRNPIFESVFLGRDGLTRVWKVRAPSIGGAARQPDH